MAKPSGDQLKKLGGELWPILKKWAFWQRIISLIVLPIALGILIFYSLSELKVYWFGALVFVVSVMYLIFALMVNNDKKDFDLRMFGGWFSIRKHKREE